VDFLTNDPGGDFGEVLHEGGVQLLELRPQHLIEEALRRAHHDRIAALARITIRRQSIAPTQGKEQMPRPAIGHRELHLIVGSCRPISASLAFRRSRAASAAFFSPAVPAPK